MATLLIEHDNQRRAGALIGRVLIGRWPINQIVLDDPSVSRLHAWIDERRGEFHVCDAGSRTGTFVNGNRVGLRQPLREGDEIRIGPLRMWISRGSRIPPDATPIDLIPRRLDDVQILGGTFHECGCGAPIWLPPNFVATNSKCRFCGTEINPPAVNSSETSETVAEIPRATFCSICQSSIQAEEQIKVCTSCGLAFHAECWTENRGCAAYGCAEVGALDRVESNGIAETA
jgi:hypothetical protein